MPHTYSWIPWGKNFQKLPTVIEAELAKITEEDFVVACSKTLPREEIAAGHYAHLEIKTESDIPQSTWASLLPSPTVGRTSFRNATVLEEIVKTQGRERKRIEGLAPNWKGGGLHVTHYWRDVWPKRLLVPAMSRLAFRRVCDNHCDGNGAAEGAVSGLVVRFQIQEVLNKARPDFHDEVLRCVNLLQENVGKAGVFALDAAESDYVRRAAEVIGWELLPQASREEIVGAVVRKLGAVGRNYPAMTQKAQERLELIHRLGPQQILQGSGSFVGYFAAVFTEDLVVFENLELDHALYVIRGDWQELSRMTRTELRTEFAGKGQVERIVHTTGWEDRLTRLVKQARGEPIDPQAELF